MDDKQMQELNALEQAAFNDPVNFLNSEHNPRKWTLSSEDIANSYSITPAQLLHTEDELNPRKWNVAETIAREIWNGAANMFDSTLDGIQNDHLNTVIYRSNNMSKEDANRLVEDVLRSQVISRNRKNLEDARRVHDKWSAGIANGIGSVASMALLGYITRSPAAVGVATGVGEAYNVRNEMIDRYVEEQGSTEGVAGKLGEYNALATAYGAFAGAVEASIGVERLAAGSLNRYGKLAALQRLARQQGQYGKALAYKTGREFVASGAEEFGEEFLQSIGEDVAVSLTQDMWQDPDMKKALIQGMFGAIVGAPSGAIFYNGARKRTIDYINKWNNDKQAGLTESQIVQMTDEILGNGAHRMVDDITTRVEIQEHFGKAYDLVKQRLTEQIDATGTTPWTDQNKSKEEYIQTLADSITIPAINAANMLHIPLSDFLEIADIEKATVAGNIAWLRPITSIADIDTIIANQDAIIKEQLAAKKLGVDNEDVLKRARQRKAIAQRVRQDLTVENAIANNRRTIKKETADYVTAKDLQPEQVTTLESAVQAAPGQEYVLFAGKRIPVEYQVVELSEIQPSHIDGTANPNYTNTEMQNRASRGTTQDVADLREKATNITPERLMRASTSAEGAPVVNARGEVIAGNGRAEIVRYAYENPESTEKYKKALVDQGFNIEGMERPILVRRNTTLTDQEQVAAADISNISETSAFDEASQARRDVQYLKDSPTDIDFAAKLPMSERRGLMQNNGRWNKRKVQQRYEDAILAWLCGNDTQLFENLVLDRGLSQKVIDILTANGALVYETATKYPELQIREDIYHALIKMQRATRDNFLEVTQQLELDGRDVMPENILVYNWLFADPTTNRNFLSNYATILANNHENVGAGQDMFGQQVAPLSKKDALMQALKKADEAKAELSASRGREYAPLFDEEGKTTDVNLAAAIASYQNQFAPQTEEQQLYQLAYISGTTYYEKPSTKYVLRGGEGQIVHGWGIYALKDKEKNKIRYREGKFAGTKVFVRDMPNIQQNIKGAKNQKESQIFKMVLDTIAGRTPINMYKQIGFAGGISSYVPLFYMDALYEVIGDKANQADKAFLEKVIEKGQIADETIFKVDPNMSQWLQRAIVETLDMHNDLKNSKFYQKDLPYIFIEAITLKDVQKDLLKLVEKEFKHKDLSAKANKELAKTIVSYVQNGGRIEYEPFDNAIFQEAGAQVLEFKSNRAQVAVEKMIDTIKGGYRQIRVDEVVTRFPETYSGYIGLLTLYSQSPFTPTTDLIYRINNGQTTLSDIEQDPDFQHMKKQVEKYKNTEHKQLITPGYVSFVDILESAKKIYDSEEFNKDWPYQGEDTKTWIALSEAVKNLTQEQIDSMGLYLVTTFDMKPNEAELMIDIMQHPENIKTTRGQQLEIDVPEDDALLNADQILSKQPSADKIRQILTDFLPGGLGFDFIKRAQNHNFDKFQKENNIPEKDLTSYYERILDEVMQHPEDTKALEPLTNYLMDNLTGDNFYIALGEAIQDTYIELKSGEEIGEVKDYDEGPSRIVMGVQIPIELARDISLFLNDQGIKGIKYRGGIDGTGFVIFDDNAIQVLNRLDDELPIYYQKRGVIRGQYDAELQAILLTKYWNETTLVHEWHHRFLEKMFNYFKEAQTGERAVSDEFMADVQQLFNILDIQPTQDQLTTVQQEKFATMVEAYLTGLGVDNPENLAFKGFLHWIPEQYKSILNLGYLDEEGNIVNPVLDEETVKWFNKWFANPFAPSLPTSPEVQHLTNATDGNGQIIASNQKVMNNREKDWGQDSEEQNKADAQLWRAINENTPNDMRAALDGEKERMKAESNNQPDDTKLPEEHKPTMREKWFKTYQPDARERAAAIAREYLAKNPEKARELAFADPETSVEYEAPVDRGMLIRAVMETVPHGSDEWYILNDNLATVKSMSGSTLSLSGDQSHQAYLDAKREVEAARELKAAINYAGTRYGAMEKWNEDIRAFIARKTAGILATAPNSPERKVAIKAFLEEAKTKFSANTTNAVFNQMDLTGLQTKNSQVFIKWAEKQIKQATHAKIDTAEQKELMKASIAAQLALKEIDSIAQIDGKFTRAVQSAKDIRHWQFVKDKMKKAYIGRWGKWGIWVENLFGGYMPSAMLMSVNTLFFANVPSTALNTVTTRLAAKVIGDNKVDNKVQKDEIERIRQVFNASGVNLAQMDKPTSPSTLHGEKYMNTEQKHWYNFTFEVLGRTDNLFRIPTFVDTLARIATKNADGDKTKATLLFKAYAQINNQDEEAKMARKQALAVANMAVFTQDGMMATALNHIRSNLNTISRAPLGLDPNGFGLGNLLAPFLKTGVNITEMGLSATLALPKTVIMGLKKLKGKEITDLNKIALRSDWINLAWTAVMMALLCALSGDDDKWYEEPYQTGRKYDPNKPYDSIRFGNTWVKMDIFGPVAIPLRTAAMLVQEWEKRKLAAVADGMIEALSETPLINAFTDSSMDYMQRQPGAYWSSFGYNQLNKFIPAQAKTLTRAGSRATGAKLNTSGLGKTISRKFHRNYGFDGAELTTNDLINILTNRLKYNPQ